MDELLSLIKMIYVSYWPYLLCILGVIIFILTVMAAGHAIIYKRDPRAAVGWLGVIMLAPGLGATLYYLLGINRVQRKAQLLFKDRDFFGETKVKDRDIYMRLERDGRSYLSLAQLVDRVTRHRLVVGNLVEPLTSGSEAYQKMLRKIDEAKKTLTLSTYIFDNDPLGKTFLTHLKAAVKRGVEVRVLIDAVGARYSFPSIIFHLRRAGIPVARFMPTAFPWHFHYMQLRNHRKLLVVDGTFCFMGGMNIREGHRLEASSPHAIQDIHFYLEGPVVNQLQEIFIEDWYYTTGELLKGKSWIPTIGPVGNVVARRIADGPDEYFDKLRWTLQGALACAQKSVKIVTPYFVPDTSLVTSLGIAALRGIEVEIYLPQKNNLFLVQWASQSLLWQVLERGCRIFLTPPPFDHSKIMVVDGKWSLIGSANWDARSLRLNFELNLECYDDGLSQKLLQIILNKKQSGREITLEDVDKRSFPVKLRDGIARLFSPYL